MGNKGMMERLRKGAFSGLKLSTKEDVQSAWHLGKYTLKHQ